MAAQRKRTERTSSRPLNAAAVEVSVHNIAITPSAQAVALKRPGLGHKGHAAHQKNSLSSQLAVRRNQNGRRRNAVYENTIFICSDKCLNHHMPRPPLYPLARSADSCYFPFLPLSLLLHSSDVSRFTMSSARVPQTVSFGFEENFTPFSRRTSGRLTPTHNRQSAFSTGWFLPAATSSRLSNDVQYRWFFCSPVYILMRKPVHHKPK
jgi:hypothetical protein